MFLGREKRLTIDLGELEPNEKELLSGFLRSSLKVDVVLGGDKASVVSGRSSPEELKRFVNKFVYHKNLNHKYWVALEDGVIKVQKFEKVKKQEKRRKDETPPSTIAHGW